MFPRNFTVKRFQKIQAWGTELSTSRRLSTELVRRLLFGLFSFLTNHLSLNVAQGGTHPESSFPPQDYYRQTMSVDLVSLTTLVHGVLRPCSTYMTGYGNRSTSDGEPNLGFVDFYRFLTSSLTLFNRYFVEETQPGKDDASAGEQDASLFGSGEP